MAQKRTQFVVSLVLPKQVTRKEMCAYIGSAVAEYKGCLKSQYDCDLDSDDPEDHAYYPVTDLDPDTVRVLVRPPRKPKSPSPPRGSVQISATAEKNSVAKW